MKEFQIAVEVRKVYNVTVEAESFDQARAIVEGMQSTEIAETGSLQNVETEIVSDGDEYEDFSELFTDPISLYRLIVPNESLKDDDRYGWLANILNNGSDDGMNLAAIHNKITDAARAKSLTKMLELLFDEGYLEITK